MANEREEIFFDAKFDISPQIFEATLDGDTISLDVGFDNAQIITVTPDRKDFYEGEYIITPSVESQTLETADRLMKDNLEILAIPYFEVSNEYGNTVIIGG